MSEGLSAGEVGNQLVEHRHHTADSDGRDRLISIIEAVLLAVVALLAAWSGYSAAKWSTESRVSLALASTDRVEASNASLSAMEIRNFDASTFDAWFTAYVAEDEEKMAVAERRFRPEFDVAFQAWLATDPENNPDAPPGPTYMPEYEQPELERAAELDEAATEAFEEGEEQGRTADDYVRSTVYLATVLFLVGISGHFRYRVARYGLVGVASVMLVAASIQLLVLPKPPA